MKKLVRDRGAVAAAAGLLLYTSTGMALETKPMLTLDVAKKMALRVRPKPSKKSG